MPKYQRATPFDLIRTIKNMQDRLRMLEVQNAGVARKVINQTTASLSANGYFWGGDSTGWTATNGTFMVASDPPAGAEYAFAGLYTNNGSAAGSMQLSASPFPVTPGQAYQVSAFANSNTSPILIGMVWTDGNYNVISGPANPSFTVTPNAWAQLSTVLIAPSGAVYAYPCVGTPNADSSITYAQNITTLPYVPINGAWHDLRPCQNSFSGTISGRYPPQYMLDSQGFVNIAGFVQFPASNTTNYTGVTFATLPAGYRPSSTVFWPISGTGDGIATPIVQVASSGAMSFNLIAASSTGGNIVDIFGRFPLDSTGLIPTN